VVSDFNSGLISCEKIHFQKSSPRSKNSRRNFLDCNLYATSHLSPRTPLWGSLFIESVPSFIPNPARALPVYNSVSQYCRTMRIRSLNLASLIVKPAKSGIPNLRNRQNTRPDTLNVLVGECSMEPNLHPARHDHSGEGVPAKVILIAQGFELHVSMLLSSRKKSDSRIVQEKLQAARALF
jgi:hypothetical protein